MRSDLTRIINCFNEAVLAPDSWPEALAALGDFIGADGAAYIIRGKQGEAVDWAIFSGPSAELKPDYVNHFARLDPYAPLIEVDPNRSWLQLSQCLPQEALRNDAWYNDFVMKAGIGDILGVQLAATPSNSVIFGVHQEIGRGPFASERVALMNSMLDPLRRAARLHLEIRSLGWQSTIALRALDRLSGGVIIVECDGRVVEMNHTAERIVRRNDGLLVRNGRLSAHNDFETGNLGRFIAAAANERTALAMDRIIVLRRDRVPRYKLTVVPLSVKLGFFDRPLAMLLVTELGVHAAPSDSGEREHSQTVDESPLPGRRYFFHISNGDTYVDEMGAYFTAREDAEAHGSVIARELAEEGDWQGSWVSVTDDEGKQIARLPIGK